MNEFTLRIEMVNADTLQREEIVQLLMRVAVKLRQGFSEDSIIDASGNKVGEWKAGDFEE